MGTSYQFSCNDCKKTHLLGWAPYNAWAINVLTKEDWHQLTDDLKKRKVNNNILKCLEEHDGHHYVLWSWDFCHEENKRIIVTNNYTTQTTILVHDWLDHEIINMDFDE